MKAMLFAAGLGTRLKPFTNKHPKALVTINRKPLLQRNIEYLKSFGINEFVINIHHFGEQIIHFLEINNYFNCIFHISDEAEQVLETGGGLVKAKKLLQNKPFLVMNVDILTNLNINNLITFHNQNDPLITLAISDRASSRKLMFDAEMQLCGWINLLTGEEINTKTQVYKVSAFSGIHIINPNIFNKIKETGKFSIMKTYMELMKSEKILGYDHSGDILIDVGKPEAILKAESFFK